MALTAAAIRSFLVDTLEVDAEDVASDDTPLFSAAMLDSFAMVELMTFIEAETGLALGPQDATLENLDSINRIMAMVGDGANG